MCWSTSRSRGVRASSSVSGCGRGAGERVEHEAGEPRREDRVAVVHPADGVGELVAGDVLGHVAARAGADHGDHVLGGVGDRQRQEAGAQLAAPRCGGSPRRRRRRACARRAARRRAQLARSRATASSTVPPRRRSRAAGSSSARTPARNSSWSSTIRTRGALKRRLQHELDLGAARRARDHGAAAVALHAPHDRLAHAAPVGGQPRRGRTPGRGRGRRPGVRAVGASA